MEVQFSPDVQAKLDEMARDTGRRSDELVAQDAVIGFFEELASARESLEHRYHDLENGRATPIDGEDAYERLMKNTNEERRKRGQ